jgi:hypothetical protein
MCSQHLRYHPQAPTGLTFLSTALLMLPLLPVPLPQVSESDLKPVAQGDVKLGGTAGKSSLFSRIAK